MENMELGPYRRDTALTYYLPIPRQVMEMGLPSMAVLLYGLLLGRAALSQRNGYADESGWVYVVYTLEQLSKDLHISDTAVKRHLRVLEDKGLIRRTRGERYGASRIFLRVPMGSIMGTKCTGDRPKMAHGMGTKVPTSYMSKLHNRDRTYDYEEGESL